MFMTSILPDASKSLDSRYMMFFLTFVIVLKYLDKSYFAYVYMYMDIMCILFILLSENGLKTLDLEVMSSC